MSAHPDIVSLYGNIKLPKSWCPECEGYAFVIEREFRCCGREADHFPAAYKRECSPEATRRVPPLDKQKEILETQGYCCYYCGRMFNSPVRIISTKTKHLKRVVLRREWDHLVPWSHSRDNRMDNFVAACHICNHWKGSRLFQTTEEAQVFLSTEWERHKWIGAHSDE